MKIIMHKEGLKRIHLNNDPEKLEVELDCDVRNGEDEMVDAPGEIVGREFEEEGLVVEEAVHLDGENVEVEKVFEQAGDDGGKENEEEEECGECVCEEGEHWVAGNRREICKGWSDW